MPDSISPLIEAKLSRADAYDAERKDRMAAVQTARQKAKNLRISAAIDLVELRRLVQEEGYVWVDWCKANLPQHSARKISHLLRLVDRL